MIQSGNRERNDVVFSMKAASKASASSQFFAKTWFAVGVLIVSLVSLPGSASSFTSTLNQNPARTFVPCKLYSTNGSIEDVERELQRARAVLEKSKAKLAAKKEESSESSVPFFAHTGKRAVSRDGVVKSKDEKTGLITADGERMAAISELEDWEARSLSEVFKSEISEDQDVYSLASQQLADRDVAASIWGLRQKLQTEDYQRIFDKRNRFIGEDT